eukprot:ctg_1044.g378
MARRAPGTGARPTGARRPGRRYASGVRHAGGVGAHGRRMCGDGGSVHRIATARGVGRYAAVGDNVRGGGRGGTASTMLPSYGAVGVSGDGCGGASAGGLCRASRAALRTHRRGATGSAAARQRLCSPATPGCRCDRCAAAMGAVSRAGANRFRVRSGAQRVVSGRGRADASVCPGAASVQPERRSLRYPSIADSYSALPDALHATLDALECDARLRLARGEHVDALAVAALYHDHAAAYVHDGCRARLIEALLLQCACRLRAAGIVDGGSSTVTAPALPYALTAAALAESLADRPLHRRARLALAQVYLGMRNIAAVAEHLQALRGTADIAAEEKVKAMTRSVPDAESGWSGDERARWCLLRASWCLLQEEEEEEEETEEATTEQRWNRKSEALSDIQHALQASDSVHRRRDAPTPAFCCNRVRPPSQRIKH